MDQDNNSNLQISEEQVNMELDSILKEMEELDENYNKEKNKAFGAIESIGQTVGIISDEMDTTFDELDNGSREYEDSLDGLVMEEVGIIEDDLEEGE